MSKVFNWREYAQDWDRMLTTERANWLQKTNNGLFWAYESFNALPVGVQKQFADEIRIPRAIYAYR